MNFFRFASQTSRLVARSTTASTRSRILTSPTKRFASYQRFPGRGGPEPRSGAGNPYSNFRPVAKLQYLWRNYQTIVLIAGAGGVTFYVINLEEVPVSRRRRFNFITPEQEKSMVSEATYNQMLREFKGRVLPREHPYTQLVARITERLIPATHGLDGGGDWQVHVIDDPNTANAFVLPGGKVFVFTGLFPIASDENGLATVIGHEIAHNVAHHVGERLSRQVFTMAATILLSLVFDVSGQFGNGIADLALTLPNGRTQESEADHIGLLLMAEACYDPQRAPDMWKRMREYEQKHGGAPPQFLSTHPSSSSRGEAMLKWMPEALEKYNESECSITARGFNEFKKITDVGRRLPGSFSILTGARRGPVQSDDDDFF